MKNHVKVISVLLAIILMISMVPMTVLQAGAEALEYEQIAVDDTKTIDDMSAVYRFTPNESGYYMCRTSEFDDRVSLYIKIYDSELDVNYLILDDYFYDNYLETACYFTAGKTYYIDIEANAWFGVPAYDFTVVKALPTAQITFKDEAADNHYERTNFNLYAVSKPVNSYSEYYTWRSSNEKVATVDQRGYVSCIAPGESTITVTADNGVTADYDLTVKPIPPLEIGVPQTIDVFAVNQLDIFSFTPQEDGIYRLVYLEGNEEDTLYDSDKNIIPYIQYTSNARYTDKLTAGETYYFYVGSQCVDDELRSYTLSVEPCVEATGISILHEDNQSFYENTDEYFYYELEPENAIPVSCTWSSSNESVATVDQYGHINFIAPGKTTVKVTAENGVSASCEITVKPIPAIEVGVPYSFDVYSDQRSVLLSFIPQDDGIYRVGYDSDSIYANVLDPNMNICDVLYSDSHCRYTEKLTAGETYYLRVYPQLYYGESETVTVSVERCVEPTGVRFTQGESYTAYEKTQTEFICEFEPENAFIDGSTWNSSNKKVATVDQMGCVEFIAPGKTNLSVTTKNGLSASCEVTVKPIPALSPDVPQTFEVNSEDQYDYFSFTPQEDGFYRLIVDEEDAYVGHVYLLDSDMCYIQEAYEGWNRPTTVSLSAGETYYYSTYSFLAYSDPGTVSLKVERCVEPTRISIVEGERYTAFEKTNAEFSYELEPENAIDSGCTWSSSNESVAIVDQTGRVSFIAPGKTSVKVESENGLSASCEVTVKEIPALRLYEQTDGLFADHNESLYYSFTPEESGFYRFNILSKSNDIAGELLDSQMDETIGMNYGYDYGIKRKLEAGKTYYLKLDGWATRFSVSVVPDKGAVDLEIISAPDRDTYIRDLLYGEIDFSGLQLRILFDDGSEKIWKYSENDSLFEGSFVELYCDEGQIRATYDGLTASCQLTLIDNPVDHIEIDSVPKTELYYGDLRYFYEHIDKKGQTHYKWSLNAEDWNNDILPDGFEFTVYYLDGTSAKFTSKDVKDRRIDGHYFSFGYNKDDNEIKIGKNYLTFYYMDHKADFAVEVKDPGIASIEILNGPDNPAFAPQYGFADWNGLEFRIHYTSGAYTDVKLDDNNWTPRIGSFITFTANGSEGSIIKQNDKYVLRYLGAECPVEIKELSEDEVDVIGVEVEEFSYETGKLRITVEYADHTKEHISVDGPLYKERIGPRIYLWIARYSHGLFYCSINLNGTLLSVFGIPVNMDKTPILGDVDGDGEVLITDATFIQRMIADIRLPFSVIDETADVDGDGQITVMDATFIQKWLADLNTDERIGKPIA